MLLLRRVSEQWQHNPCNLPGALEHFGVFWRDIFRWFQFFQCLCVSKHCCVCLCTVLKAGISGKCVLEKVLDFWQPWNPQKLILLEKKKSHEWEVIDCVPSFHFIIIICTWRTCLSRGAAHTHTGMWSLLWRAACSGRQCLQNQPAAQQNLAWLIRTKGHTHRGLGQKELGGSEQEQLRSGCSAPCLVELESPPGWSSPSFWGVCFLEFGQKPVWWCLIGISSAPTYVVHLWEEPWDIWIDFCI